MIPKNRPLVFLLKPGTLKRDGQGNILDARSSVTLVVALVDGCERRIIVDSGQEGDGEIILKALEDLDIRVTDIDYIVNTHSHPDHSANNQLFPRAEVIIPEDGEEIAPGVWTLVTSGHSPDSISIVVEEGLLCGKKDRAAPRSQNPQRIVIAGDALPTRGNFEKNVPPAIHTDRGLAVKSMQKVISLADVVIPGHDLPFIVV